MIQFIRFLLVVLPALSFLVKATNVKRLTACNINDIHSMSVSSCFCQDHQGGCLTSCSTCGFKINDRHTKNTKCIPGCTNDDWNCQGCGIWFSSLCYCIRDPTKCPHTGTVKENGPMIWMLLPGSEPLVTTTDLLPGILEMARDPQRYWQAFDFAQEHYLPDKQALVLNSVRSRTMEQFHIHVCYKPTTKNPKVLTILDKAPLNPTKELKQIPGHDLFCMSVEKGKGPITGFVQAIHNFLALPAAKKKICDGLAGAAVIQDTHGNTWGCVNGDKDGPLATFCAG